MNQKNNKNIFDALINKFQKIKEKDLANYLDISKEKLKEYKNCDFLDIPNEINLKIFNLFSSKSLKDLENLEKERDKTKISQIQEEILKKLKEHSKIFDKLVSKFSLKINDLINYLEVSRATVYNYRNFDIDNIPTEHRVKIFNLFSSKDLKDLENILNETDKVKIKIIKSEILKKFEKVEENKINKDNCVNYEKNNDILREYMINQITNMPNFLNTSFVKRDNIALLIDIENISYKYYSQIIEETNEMGNIKIKRAYGDYSDERLKEWQNIAIKNGVVTIHAPKMSSNKTKNISDICLVIDAMDILYSNKVDAFCVVTSDSDFARLSQRIKEEGKKVYIIGESKAPISLAYSCDKFIAIDTFMDDENDNKSINSTTDENIKTDENVKVLKIKDIKNKIRKLIDDSEADIQGGWIIFSKIVQKIQTRYPHLNYKQYGVKNLKSFYKDKIDCEFHKIGTVDYIRVDHTTNK